MRLVMIAAMTFSLLALARPVQSQQDRNRLVENTAVYLELGGPTEYASLNVDRIVLGTWALRAGIQVAGSGRSLGEHYAQVPASLSYLRYFGGHGLEAGTGVVATFNSQYSEWHALEYFFSLGYRTQPLANGLFFRAEVLTMPSRDWWNWFGVGAGYAF